MQIFDSLKRVVSELHPHEGRWAICGGIAACLYRAEPRYTGDIDIVLGGIPIQEARELAEGILSRLGYKPILGFITDLDGKLISGPALIVAREDKQRSFLGIDFLLPAQPWIEPAIHRAQINRIDYGFAELPTITPEDLIIAKLFALQSSPARPYDLDDVLSILNNLENIDFDYVNQAITQYSINVPPEVVLRRK